MRRCNLHFFLNLMSFYEFEVVLVNACVIVIRHTSLFLVTHSQGQNSGLDVLEGTTVCGGKLLALCIERGLHGATWDPQHPHSVDV